MLFFPWTSICIFSWFKIESYNNEYFDGGRYVIGNYYEGVEIVLEFNSTGGWVVYDGDGLGLMGDGGAGVAAL